MLYILVSQIIIWEIRGNLGLGFGIWGKWEWMAINTKVGEMRGMIFYTLVASASLKIIYGSAHSPMSPCCRTFSNCQRQKLKIKLFF